MGSGDRQGSEGRGLREEAGVAHRGRARGAAVLPQGSAGRDSAPFAYADAGAELGDRAGRRTTARTRFAATGCTRPARTRCRNWATRWRRAWSGWRMRTGPWTRGGQVEFVFAAGPATFVEIAKLRAARLLWAQVAGGIRAGRRRDATARAHAAAQQERLRPLHESAARDHGGASRRRWAAATRCTWSRSGSTRTWR